MESKLMDQWTNAFAKDFYRQLKARKKKSCNEAAINNSNNNHRSNMSNDNNTIIPDDIISTINDFKRSKKWINDTDPWKRIRNSCS